MQLLKNKQYLNAGFIVQNDQIAQIIVSSCDFQLKTQTVNLQYYLFTGTGKGAELQKKRFALTQQQSLQFARNGLTALQELLGTHATWEKACAST